MKEVERNIKVPNFEERRRLLSVSATRTKWKLHIVGQTVAYGSKRNENQVINQFLIESCEVTDTEFPDETQPDNKKRRCFQKLSPSLKMRSVLLNWEQKQQMKRQGF